MIKEHVGYHEMITGKEAEQRLKKHGGHCYLTRYSKIKDCYILSVYEHLNASTWHFKIAIDKDGKHKILERTKLSMILNRC